MNDKTNKTVVVKKPPRLEMAVPTPETLMQHAIDNGASVDTLERLMAMRRELKEEWAKEQYDKAMAKFQAQCPTIIKTKEVKTKTGQVAYKYTPIESIVKQIKSDLQKNGFSYAVKQEMNLKDRTVKSICVVKHKDGHSENSEMEVPLGNKTPVMSDTQVVAAASTFAKRYAFCNAFGILTGDDDNDGASFGKQPKKKAEVKQTQIQKFNTAKNLIGNIKDGKKLMEVMESLETSKLYNKTQKAELNKIISQKLDEIDNPSTT